MVRISFSELSCYRSCPRMYLYRYIMNLRTKRINRVLELGTLIHSCLELYHKKLNWQEAILGFNKTMDGWPIDDELQTIPADASRIVAGYINHWHEADSRVKTVSSEESFCVDMGGYELEGRFDWLCESEKGLWIVDHKSTSKMPEDTPLATDLQLSLYYEVATMLGYKPIGVVADYIRTKAPSAVPLNKNGTVSRKKCDTDKASYISAILASGQDVKDYEDILSELKPFYKRMTAPRVPSVIQGLKADMDYSAKGITEALTLGQDYPAPRHFDNFRCKFCEYRRLCEMSLYGSVEQIIHEEYEVGHHDELESDPE